MIMTVLLAGHRAMPGARGWHDMQTRPLLWLIIICLARNPLVSRIAGHWMALVFLARPDCAP